MNVELVSKKSVRLTAIDSDGQVRIYLVTVRIMEILICLENPHRFLQHVDKTFSKKLTNFFEIFHYSKESKNLFLIFQNFGYVLNIFLKFLQNFL